MAQFALRWILGYDAVSTVIPGAKAPEQVRANAAASSLPALPAATLERIGELYRKLVSPLVDRRW
jgi:aryl-alcohol dehydrogenase-like predicted oxidoreductase